MKRPIFALALLVLLPTTAFAAGEVDCSGTCSEGESMVSYADGNNVGCNCVQSAQMEETVADPNVVEGEINEAD